MIVLGLDMIVFYEMSYIYSVRLFARSFGRLSLTLFTNYIQ